MCVLRPLCTNGGQRATCQSVFCFHMLVLGTELRLSGAVAGALSLSYLLARVKSFTYRRTNIISVTHEL